MATSEVLNGSAKELSWGEVKRWNSAGLDEARSQVKSMIDKLQRESDELARTNTTASWTGHAADAASSAQRKLIDDLEHQAAQLGKARQGLSDAASAVDSIESLVRSAQSYADQFGFAISDEGEVTDPHPPPLPPGASQNDAQVQQQQRSSWTTECAQLVTDVVTRASQIDSDLAGVLQEAHDDTGGDGGATSLQQAVANGASHGHVALESPAPPDTPLAEENAAWWKSLTAAEQDDIVKHHPQWVGNRNGVPVEARSKANEVVLEKKLTEYDAEMKRLAANEPGRYRLGPHDTMRETSEWKDWKRDMDSVKNKYDGSKTIHDAMASNTQGKSDNTYLMGYEPDVGKGRAMTSVGNPDTATTTNTFVTGMGTHIGGISGDMNRSLTMRQDAIAAGAGSKSTAAITWYGYDAPQNLVEAGSRDKAEAAAPALDDFQRSLRVTHQGDHPSFNTVTSHSYGTAVTGQAAAHGNVLNAGRVIFLASPGVTVRNIHDLHITGAATNDNPSHLFASTAMNDPIQLTKGTTLGMAPDQYGFGATEFKTPNASDSWWWDSDSHGTFWDQDESREKIGAIIADKTP